MNQENVNKLVDWIKANRNYPAEQLKQSALQGGSSKEDFNAALNIANTPVAALEYKGVGIRFFALIIDTIIFGILFWLFIKIFWGAHVGGCKSSTLIGYSVIDYVSKNETFYGLCNSPVLLYFLVIFIYYVLLEWKLGGTLGKLTVGMRVVKSTGEPLNLKASLIRNVMRIVDFLPFFYLVGAISIWNSKTKQRVGDRLAKTVVVSKFSIK
ncbi:RDD family protein [Patescibacteria group bacterium]|nr:RDD family protein [Patescibacteria group bacterium]MBU1783370.1 RDD family protein [Patescibacteria group bacterium]MBU1991475.1 RDD family protein [Patescibacteria group bacterium]MBU2081166.1 RDD family protein [Patescibacteria group bacterium]